MDREGLSAGKFAAFHRNMAALLVIWILITAGSLLWNIHNAHQNTLDLAKKEAVATFNKDQAFRLWVTKHGGVYVPPTDETPPNPYLAHIPDRDIHLPSGKNLTLMNPAYVLRQVMNEYEILYGVKGHITSLKLRNPVNAPDVWEREALEAFERGEKEEVFEFTHIAGAPYLRLMRSMVTQKGCLKCHAFQGYKEGDIRGGVGVSVPMSPFLLLEKKTINTLIFSHVFIWLMGITGLGAVFYKGREKIAREVRTESEIKKLNEELEHRVRERTAQLEAANKELESFSYSVSHDLRTPLRAIDGFSRIILEDYAGLLDSEGKRLLNILRDNTLSMERLINDILAFSRMGRKDVSADIIDMESLARDVYGELMPSAGTRAIKMEIKSLPQAYGDRSMIRQVFTNLVSNAIKFTNKKDAALVEIGGYTEAGGNNIYYVKDNGSGFDMQYSDRLFGVFQRLHSMEAFEGTGIGLAIVKRIIEKHGGKVWAEGKVNEGATFYFSLPERSVA